MRDSKLKLLEVQTNRIVDAKLKCGGDYAFLASVEQQWCELRRRGAAQIRATGGQIPEHYHWNWLNKLSKLDLSGYEFFSIECDSKIQGIMALDALHVCRLPANAGKRLVYVDFIENAPWNIRRMTPNAPIYRGVGSALIRAALDFSKSKRLGRRVGLHSLPQSEAFYEKVCNMKRLDSDANYQNLVWFEHDADSAAKFLEGK